MFAQHTWLMMWYALVVQLEYHLSKAPYLPLSGAPDGL